MQNSPLTMELKQTTTGLFLCEVPGTYLGQQSDMLQALYILHPFFFCLLLVPCIPLQCYFTFPIPSCWAQSLPFCVGLQLLACKNSLRRPFLICLNICIFFQREWLNCCLICLKGITLLSALFLMWQNS